VNFAGLGDEWTGKLQSLMATGFFCVLIVVLNCKDSLKEDQVLVEEDESKWENFRVSVNCTCGSLEKECIW